MRQNNKDNTKEQTIEKIYQTSARMFMEHGYENVRVSDICKAVNITKPTFYSYNLTKEDLLLHAYHEDYDELPEQWYSDENPNILQDILRGIDSVLKRTLDLGPQMLRSLISANLEAPRFGTYFFPNWHDRLIDLLSQGQNDGLIRNPSSPEFLIYEMMLYTLGYSIYYSTGHAHDISMDHYHRQILSVLNVPKSVKGEVLNAVQ